MREIIKFAYKRPLQIGPRQYWLVGLAASYSIGTIMLDKGTFYRR
jgi:hypothetical protein